MTFWNVVTKSNLTTPGVNASKPNGAAGAVCGEKQNERAANFYRVWCIGVVSYFLFIGRNMKKQFVYYCELLDYIDGDTMDIVLDKGDDETRGSLSNPVRVRLANCDTPEIRGELRPFGLFVKDYCENVMPVGQNYQLISEGLDRDNFARFLVDFVGSNDQTLSRHLIALGYAIPYFDENGRPKSKDQRTAEHIRNMNLLIDNGLIL